MNVLRYILNPKTFAAGVSLFVLGFLGLGVAMNPAMATLPQDCDDIAIIRCGFQSPSEFISDYNANKQGDLKLVYKEFGLTDSQVSRLSQLKWGWSYRDGRIILDDGRVVATNGWSIGRQHGGNTNPYTWKTLSNGVTYYWGYNNQSFADSTTRIRTLILMDENDKYMQFGVMTSCGNPSIGTKPEFQCDMLQKKQLGNDEFEFWTDATAKSGASVKSVTYNFNDGTANETRSTATEHVKHTFPKAGTYHVTVTVTYNVNGHDQTEAVQAHCQTDVTVNEKLAVCSSLTPHLIEGNRKYNFTVVGHTENGPKLVSASFDFGDGQKADNVTDVKDDSITVSHTYKDSDKGTINISADLTFTDGLTDKGNPKCKAQIELKAQTCADTPTAPECQPPKTCKELGTCKVVLASTGPEDSIISAISVGSFAGAGMYYRATRKNLLSNIFKFKR